MTICASMVIMHPLPSPVCGTSRSGGPNFGANPADIAGGTPGSPSPSANLVGVFRATASKRSRPVLVLLQIAFFAFLASAEIVVFLAIP